MTGDPQSISAMPDVAHFDPAGKARDIW